VDASILYTPILKGKANDLKALGRLPRPLASYMLPMVELLAPNEGERIDANCGRLSSQLRKHCPLQTVSLDLHSIAPADRLLRLIGWGAIVRNHSRPEYSTSSGAWSLKRRVL
jgi:hypothetical protein